MLDAESLLEIQDALLLCGELSLQLFLGLAGSFDGGLLLFGRAGGRLELFLPFGGTYLGNAEPVAQRAIVVLEICDSLKLFLGRERAVFAQGAQVAA